MDLLPLESSDPINRGNGGILVSFRFLQVVRQSAAAAARTKSSPFYHSQWEGRPMLRTFAAALAVVLCLANSQEF